ncbi:PREDICTED: ubiquitin carboxyl-terminal hydrolase 23-like [Ipomoea nil]|uniref:ubiquitin carboxyl-terminal hydrolase 23-like n=1 Tax=Ipomoea nil TaxID=35883 RepID=UPI00090147B2|nr:PREDICTED: ubiquitin carboxyl-terminal hydrolase 23-like [Ipomoea nil]
MESSLDPLAAGESEQISGMSLFHRRIEFHLARKSFNGFGNGSGGFRLETLNPSSNSASVPGKAPGPGNPPSNKGSSNDGLDFDPELSLNITFRKIMRIGAGLENLGNTCFLNAVLQCLTYTEPLAAYLESGKHQNSCRKAGFCALCAIQRHVSRALQATGRILAPKDLVSNLRCISRNFRNARQEDAHEYMVNLLESMHKCCLPSGIPSESPGAYEKSLVHRMFGGRLRSRVKCMQCSYCSDKYDPFLDLSLEIIKADSLYKALEHFTAPELLDGGEKQYSCQQCKQKVRARKQLSVDKAPHVLTIHLKRFGSHLPGQKIDKKIHYGPVLDLNRFMSSPHTSDLKYTLYAVLVHAGWSTHSGHYYCFVRTSSGMWYSLDDNQVFQVNERKVLEQKAYMLFYVRDRKSSLPKRHVDVAHKDSSLINGVGIKEHKCGSTKEASITAGICSPLTATLGNVSDGTHNICRVPTAMTRPIGCNTDVRMKDVNVPMPALPKSNSTVDKDSSGSIVLPLSCNEDVINEKDSSDNSSHKPDDDSILKKSLVRCSKGKSIPGKVLELSEQKLKEAGQLKSNQIHGFSKGNETSEIGSDILVTLSDPLRTSKTKPLKANGKTNLKVRKKPFKSHITSMHLSSLIFGTALYVRRKRKQKLRKHCISRIDNRSLEYLNGEHALPSSLGPTSEQAKVLTTRRSLHKKRLTCVSDVEVYNSGVKGQLDTGHLQRRMVNEVPKERAGNVETVLMTDKQSGLMNMLTRGLEGTTVPSWDGEQISPLDVTEPGNECVKIGYIGDEWDEHYDEGKRKKVRSSKLDFGGPNPFQEIASKKAKLKRAKLANQPIRI